MDKVHLYGYSNILMLIKNNIKFYPNKALLLHHWSFKIDFRNS